MAVTKGKPFLNLDSDRDSKFYNDYLARNELIINNGIKDVISCRRDVINYLEDQRLPQEIKNDLIKKMKQALKYEVIPSTEFDWISSSDRASYWVWGVLKIADFNYLGYSSIRNPFPDLPQGYTFYDWIVFNKTPSSTPERIDAIVEFFDRWKCAPEMKKELLQKLKIYWKGVTNMPDPFSCIFRPIVTAHSV
ncbi:hypothetical protein BDK62_12820 [Halomonas alkaliantarctica]|nr:hypothetical protein BDK62_12820 [Halomonas alkaliantarctica]